MARPRVVHMAPVFATRTGEPGWLVRTGRRDAPLARHLPGLDPELCTWEPPVKAWFVHEDRAEDARDALGAAHDGVVGFCAACVRDGCGVWRDLEPWGFARRDADQVEPEPAAPPEPPPPPRRPADPGGAPLGFDWVGFAEEFFADVLRAPRAAPPPPPPAAAGMAPADAARVLGVAWPCDRPAAVAAFRRAALAAHPDRGGSDAAMARVNAAREALLRALPG